ncbi:MAG: DUF302 domain-containing protein [Solirubrobacteraceae bacterium]
MVVTVAHGDADEVEGRLVKALDDRGVKRFARIDHAAAAREAGLELGEERVLVFGNPQGGTPLMLADRRVGIELPLRMLIWEDDEGTKLGYNDPRTLAGSYRLEGHEQTLEQMATLLATLAGEAAG